MSTTRGFWNWSSHELNGSNAVTSRKSVYRRVKHKGSDGILVLEWKNCKQSCNHFIYRPGLIARFDLSVKNVFHISTDVACARCKTYLRIVGTWSVSLFQPLLNHWTPGTSSGHHYLVISSVNETVATSMVSIRTIYTRTRNTCTKKEIRCPMDIQVGSHGYWLVGSTKSAWFINKSQKWNHNINTNTHTHTGLALRAGAGSKLAASNRP